MWGELHATGGLAAQICTRITLAIRFVEQAPNYGNEPSVFGFGEYIAGLALLVIVFTITDIRYRFRIAIAPGAMRTRTYWLLIGVGVATLFTSIWERERWLVPETLVLTRAIWEGLLAALFLSLPITWIYYAFVRPAAFGKGNCRAFGIALYWEILKGSEANLPVIADELQRSANALVTLSGQARPQDAAPRARKKRLSRSAKAAGYAHDILLMIGNRKFCRHIVASAPSTAISFFSAAAASKQTGLPLSQFARNISAEAIGNKDSILYHEDEGFQSGYFGYVKPFSEAIYGNYPLVEELGRRFGSPLDIRYTFVGAWDEAQLSTYTRVVLITFNSYLKETHSLFVPSPSLHRAMGIIKSACSDTYKLDGVAESSYNIDVADRLFAAVQFFADAVAAIDRERGLQLGPLRVKDGSRMTWGFCDHLAESMVEIITLASAVTKPSGMCWSIHYITVWSKFFGHFDESPTWKAIRFKLRRRLYDEIRQIERIPNYRSSRILGLCLNVMGFGPLRRGGIDKSYFALTKALRAWTKKHYMVLRQVQPDVAASCLVGSITFDEANRRLVKTYIKGLSLEPPKEYLELDPAPGVPLEPAASTPVLAAPVDPARP
jgi:hypothetical protein